MMGGGGKDGEKGELGSQGQTCKYSYIQNGSPAGTYCMAHGALLIVMWQPGWERSLVRMDTCMWMAESLLCSPENTTTLLLAIPQCILKS